MIPHEHAGYAERLPHRVVDDLEREPTLDESGDRRRYRADRGAFDQRGVPHQKQAGHGDEDQERQYAGAQKTELIGPAHVPFFRRKGGPERWSQLAAHDNIDDEQGGHEQTGQRAREPELAYRLARDHAVEHQHNARRHQDAERAAGLDHAGDHDLVVAAPEQFRQGDGGADRHAGDAQSVHGRYHNHQQDRTYREPAVERPGPDMEHLVEVVGDAGLREHVAHIDEQWQRQQGIPLHQLDGLREGHFGPAVAPQEQGRHDRHEADGAEHALTGQQHEHHG